MNSSDVDRTVLDWRKSSRSSSGACVHIARVDHEHIAIRNSNDPGGPMVLFNRREVAAFRAGLNDGEFDDI
jgi:hypothetical protein